MIFRFDSQTLTLQVDFDADMTCVKETVSKRLGIPAADLAFLFQNSELNDGMTLNDLEVSPTDWICAEQKSNPARAPADAAAPSVKDISCVLLIGVVPRLMKFKLETTQTVADLERLGILRWNLWLRMRLTRTGA
jgi:hypothetical protein